ADPVAAGRRAVEDDDVAGALRPRGLQPGRVEYADAHRVDEAVAGIGLVEDRRSADVRDADRVAVAPDTGDRALKLVIRGAEPQAVEESDRPRAHRDDVAENPADSCRGSLEGLDRGRVIVRLDLERHGDAFAEVEDAGVFTRPLK